MESRDALWVFAVFLLSLELQIWLHEAAHWWAARWVADSPFFLQAGCLGVHGTESGSRWRLQLLSAGPNQVLIR